MLSTHVLRAAPRFEFPSCILGQGKERSEEEVEDFVRDEADQVEWTFVRTDQRHDELVIDLL